MGVFKGAVGGIFDLSTIPTDTKILDMSTPLKKFKLTYTNISSLNANKNIEAIRLGEIDDERVNVFSTLPNLKYLHVTVNKQNSIRLIAFEKSSSFGYLKYLFHFKNPLPLKVKKN